MRPDPPQTGLCRVVDGDGPLACAPSCQHFLTLRHRPGGFRPQPAGGPSSKGRPNLCAVVDIATFPGTNRYPEYMTACGEVLSGSFSRFHRAPNCPDCRRALKASGIDLDLEP